MSYAGNYGERNITLKDGRLYYQRGDGEIHPLTPLTQDLFKVGNIEYFRLEVLKKDGEVVGLRGHYDNGHTDESKKMGG